MASLDRIVAGLSCREVLADLSDVVDGALPADRVEAIGRHLAGCQVCESFGGRFAEMVRRVRGQLAAHDAAVPLTVSARLRERLAREFSEG
jgi:anti-sigma factor RsiW